ncbi:MAG: phage major capsid protein, partial [Nitrospiraceae bacterium]
MEKERVIVRDGEEARVEGRLKRFISFARESVKETERTVELSFSSESPVERWWGWETLDHAAKSVRLGRLNDGGAVLVDHGGDQIGVVEQAEIAADRKGRALLRFGKGQRAMEVFQDIVDGIRRNVSVSYIIHKMVMEKQVEDVQW